VIHRPQRRPADRTDGASRRRVARGTAALALASAGAFALAPAASATDTCTTPELSSGAPVAVDNTVNVYAGGHLTVRGAAEAEGVVVVGGDLSTDAHYNVGVAGAGSLVAPSKGSVMLRVGGDVSGAPFVAVGHGLDGQAAVGGTLDGALAEGTAHDGLGQAGALAGFDGLTSTLRTESQRLAGERTTGTVTDDGTFLVLRGDGTSGTQVFSLDGGKLGSATRSVSVKFVDVPDDATIVVNVGGDVRTNVNGMWREGAAHAFDQNGDRAGLASYASRTVWNVLDDASPDVAGSAQWVGSVLVPKGSGTTTVEVPGLNGRTWVAGDLVHTGGGAEFHAYPFTGSDVLTCTPEGTPTPTATPSSTPTSTTPSEAVVPSEQPSQPTDTDTPSSDQSPAPTSGEAVDATTPAEAASPSPSGTTVVLAAGGTATPSDAPDAQGEGALAETGANVVPFAVAAVVLVAAGATLLVLRRRRAA